MKSHSQFRPRPQRWLFVLLLVVLFTAVLAAPVLATQAPPYASRGAMIYTASSGGQPQGAFLNGQYVRLATEDCPAPARMLVDGGYVYVCPPTLKLPVLPKPPVQLPARLKP